VISREEDDNQKDGVSAQTGTGQGGLGQREEEGAGPGQSWVGLLGVLRERAKQKKGPGKIGLGVFLFSVFI
jgi:hypothetical protein